jgi:uncharacterized protein
MKKNLIILKIIRENLFNEFGEKIHDVILFGSRARKQSNPDSDFDILIIIDGSLSWREKNQIRSICFDISLDQDIIIDSKIVSKQEIETSFWGKHPLIVDAIMNGLHA